MYTALLTVHSYLRWLVLLTALIAIVRAVTGIARRRPWTPTDDTAARWFGISVDTQLLIGLILYFFLSPFTMSAWSDIGGAMRDATVRFIVIEHQFGMLIAVALAHIGRARIRKAQDAARRHRMALIFFGLALVIMVISIPWPGRPGGRELFRGLGL
jgi:hypothetical protein